MPTLPGRPASNTINRPTDEGQVTAVYEGAAISAPKQYMASTMPGLVKVVIKMMNRRGKYWNETTTEVSVLKAIFDKVKGAFGFRRGLTDSGQDEVDVQLPPSTLL